MGRLRRMVLRRAGDGRAGPHPPADGRRLRPRLPAGHRPGAGAGVEVAAAVRPGLGLHLAAAVDPADRAAADPVQPGLSVRDDPAGHPLHRHRLRRVSDGLAARPLCRGAAGPEPEPGRLLGRDHPRRHPVGRPGPAGGRGGAGPAAPPPGLPHRPAAGHAGDPADRLQRADRPGQGHVHGLRAGAAGAVLHGAGDLPPQPGGDPAADGRDRLVPDHHDRAVGHPVLHRAALRPRRAAHPAADADPAAAAPGAPAARSSRSPAEPAQIAPPVATALRSAGSLAAAVQPPAARSGSRACRRASGR